MRNKRSALRHLVNLDSYSADRVRDLVSSGLRIKSKIDDFDRALSGKVLLLLFSKPSTRTSLSFQSAMGKLGGTSVYMNWSQANFSISPVEYEAAYASRNCDAIVARVRHHGELLRLIEWSVCPVTNGCDDRYHPSQALADLITIYEKAGSFSDVTLTYVGVLNNVANSLIAAALAVRLRLNLVLPLRNEAAVDPDLLDRAQESGHIFLREDLRHACLEADFVYTDTWIDMEHFQDPAFFEESERRRTKLIKFQINEELLSGSKAFVMHDMPIHPGLEISESMIVDPRSIIFEQGRNRLYSAAAILLEQLIHSAD